MLFNCSWYNWVGVECVMGFCMEVEYEEFMESVFVFEKMLVCLGICFIKYYFDISKVE